MRKLKILGRREDTQTRSADVSSHEPIASTSALNTGAIRLDNNQSVVKKQKHNPIHVLKHILPVRKNSLSSGTSRSACTEALRLTGVALQEAAQASQGIPYLQCIAKAVEYIVKVNDELSMVGSKGHSLGDRVLRLRDILEEVKDTCPRPHKDTPEYLQRALEALEGVLSRVIVVLGRCDMRLWRRFLYRKEVLKSIEECNEELYQAMQELNMRLNIEQSLNMYHCQNILFSLEVQVVQSRETLRSLEAHADQTRATLLILEDGIRSLRPKNEAQYPIRSKVTWTRIGVALVPVVLFGRSRE